MDVKIEYTCINHWKQLAYHLCPKKKKNSGKKTTIRVYNKKGWFESEQVFGSYDINSKEPV